MHARFESTLRLEEMQNRLDVSVPELTWRRHESEYFGVYLKGRRPEDGGSISITPEGEGFEMEWEESTATFVDVCLQTVEAFGIQAVR